MPAKGEQHASSDAPLGGAILLRHGFHVRTWHWVNAIAFLILLISGLAIFNAHPRLYCGSYGANPDPA